MNITRFVACVLLILTFHTEEFWTEKKHVESTKHSKKAIDGQQSRKVQEYFQENKDYSVIKAEALFAEFHCGT